MKTTILSLMMLISVNAFAQVEHGNGGNLTEGDLKYFITKLDRYLQSEDGKNAFPELGKYDETHQDATINMIAKALNPTLKNGEVLDSLGNPRDCVSYTSPVRYFKCNSNTLPKNTLEHQPSFYRLVFHEILVQAGLEKPLNKEVPSEYPIASRLDVHLETFQEWVPGKIADDGSRVGKFANPSKEVLECSGTKLVTGQGAVQKGYKDIDVSVPGPYGPNTTSIQRDVLLEVDGIKVMFSTYAAGISLYIVPSNQDAKNSENWLAQSSTSLGPIRDSRDEKLFLIYKNPSNGSTLMAACSYIKYVD